MKPMNLRTQAPDLAALERSAGEVAALLRALGNERRLMLLCMLIEQGECSAGELAEGAGLSPSATSQHLAKMREEGLVESRREAQSAFYRVADPRTKRLIKLLKDLDIEVGISSNVMEVREDGKYLRELKIDRTYPKDFDLSKDI